MKSIMKFKSLFFLLSFLIISCSLLAKSIDSNYRGQRDKTKLDTVVIAGDTYYVKWLLKESFDTDNWQQSWVLETTDAEIKVLNGKLHFIDQGIGSTLWHKDEFPANIVVRYKARADGKMTDNKVNFNHFSHARENDGSLLKIGKEGGRKGPYKEYHLLTNYIATYTYSHTRIRKDPGFKLLSDNKEPSLVDKTYEIVYTVYNGRIRYYINGSKFHDVVDTTSLQGGKFGLRTWNTKGWWDDIEIGVLQEKQSGNK